MVEVNAMKLTSLWAWFILTTLPSCADLIYSPTVTNVSVRTSAFSTNTNSGYRTFDNFTPTFDAYLTTVSWFAGFIDQPIPAGPPAPLTTSWQISCYSDNNGVPGSLLTSQSVNYAASSPTFEYNSVWTFNSSYNSSVYSYRVTLPNALLVYAGQQYWISIMGLQGPSSPYPLLLGATGGDSFSYQQVLGANQSVVSGNKVSADRLLKLEGNPVPEPSTFGMMGAVLLAASLVKRKLRG
jgi:hypothetical protein